MQAPSSFNGNSGTIHFAKAKGVEEEYSLLAPAVVDEEFPAWKGLVPSTHEQLIGDLSEVKEFLYRTPLGKFVWHDIFRQGKFRVLDFHELKEIVNLADNKAASHGFYNGGIGAANVVTLTCFNKLLNIGERPEAYLFKMKKLFDDFDYTKHIKKIVLDEFGLSESYAAATDRDIKVLILQRLNAWLEKDFTGAMNEYESFLSYLEEIESRLGFKPFCDNELYLSVVEGNIYGDYLGKKRTLEELSDGRIELSSEIIDYLKKKPAFLFGFGYNAAPDNEPHVMGRCRRSSFIARVTQAKEGRGQKYPGAQFLDGDAANGKEQDKIDAVKSFLQDHDIALLEDFESFFKKLESEEKKYGALAENCGESVYAGFSLMLHEPQELFNAKCNKKDISSKERITLLQNIERSFKAASWVARSALEIEDMYKTICGDTPENDKLESLKSSLKYMRAACGSQEGMVFGAPPLHSGNLGEDAVGFGNPRSYRIMKNIFQKHGGEYVNSVEYYIKQDRIERGASDAKITVYQFSSRPEESKTGDRGIAIKITCGGMERYLGIEDILMLENDLNKETFPTLVLNGKFKRYALSNSE